VKTIVEASVKVTFAYVYNSKMTYSAHLHTDYEHAQTFFCRGVGLVTIYSHLKKPLSLTGYATTRLAGTGVWVKITEAIHF
jgi:hypothetical protein